MTVEDLLRYWSEQVPGTVRSAATDLIVQTDHTEFYQVAGIRLGNSPDGEPAIVLDIR